MVDQGFTKGSRVEVTSDDEGFKNACYVATIIDDPESNHCVVTYDHLMETEDEGSKCLTERVNVSFLRPLPPLQKDEIIKVHDIVDAYHRDGWWTGEVVEILEKGKFLVYFNDPPDEFIVEGDNLRLHMDWVNGKWEKPQRHIYKMISRGAVVEVSFESENYSAWHIGNVLQVKENNKFLVKYQCFGEDQKPKFRSEVVDSQCIRPSPPRLEEQDYVVRDKVDVYNGFCWWNGVIHEILKDMWYTVLVTQSKAEMVCNHSNLRPRLDWIDGIWTTTSQKTKLLAIDDEPLKSNRQKCRVRNPPPDRYCGTTGNNNNSIVLVDEADMSVHKEMGASSETPVKKNRKRQIRDQDIENIEGSSGIKRTPNRKRERLQKLLLEKQIGKDNLMLTTIDNDPDEDSFMLSCKDYMDLILSERKLMTRLCRPNESLGRITNISLVENLTNQTGASIRVEKLPNESLSDGHEVMIPNTRLAKGQAKKIIKKRRKKWLLNLHGETNKTADFVPQNQGVTTNIHEANETVAQKRVARWESYGNKKISRTVESASQIGGVSPYPYQCANATYGEVDGETSSAFATNDVGQFSPLQKTIAKDPSGEFGTPSEIISCNSMDNFENLPFVKCSPLWKSIESMEIFSKTKRKPHFHPLLTCKEVIREGLAIASMVTFSTVVEKTLKLRLSDPSRVIKSNLETLADLEKHGFDVEPVRARLMVLLEKKEEERKLETEYKQIENVISKDELEKDKLGQEIIQINQTMKELAEMLIETESRKAIKEDEILTLRSKQEVISKNVRRVKHEFESTAGCPL